MYSIKCNIKRWSFNCKIRYYTKKYHSRFDFNIRKWVDLKILNINENFWDWIQYLIWPMIMNYLVTSSGKYYIHMRMEQDNVLWIRILLCNGILNISIVFLISSYKFQPYMSDLKSPTMHLEFQISINYSLLKRHENYSISIKNI